MLRSSTGHQWAGSNLAFDFLEADDRTEKTKDHKERCPIVHDRVVKVQADEDCCVWSVTAEWRSGEFLARVPPNL